MITVGEPEVFGKYWKRYPSDEKGGKTKQWTMKFHWHARRERDGQCCWLAQALDHFARTQHVETRGRKKILLPKEQRVERLAIIRRRAKTIQQLKSEMEKDVEERSLDRIIHLGMKLEDYKQSLIGLGGAPKSWG